MAKQVTVTSAVQLSEKQKSVLVSGLEKKYGKVDLKEKVDENLIGGLKVTVDSQQFDATLSTKLAQLRKTLS